MTLEQRVGQILREVAATVILPRLGALGPADIAEKTPGELVTSADRAAEAMLADRLAALGLGARIVGEEAAAADPLLLNGLGEGLVWLVDPLDGTANFAAGHGPFGVMVALVGDGAPLAGWMLDPVNDRMCFAARGEGASIDGRAVRIPRSTLARPVAALATQFMSPARRARVHACADRDFDRVPIPRCAAESYPRLVLGQNDIALFQRILPWDHAAGVLFLTEAGGVARHWEGAAYRVGSRSPGLLAATHEHLWQLAAGALLPAACADIDETIAA